MSNASSMQQSTEMQFEDLLLRIVPGIAQAWQGATRDEVEQVEKIARQPLPQFYRWFLSKMGRRTGLTIYPTLDFSAKRVLSCYTEGLVAPDPRYLLIGYESDESEPLHCFYDFEAPARNDARIVLRSFEGDILSSRFETFREMWANGALGAYRLDAQAQRCRGIFNDESGEGLCRLDPVIEGLGFVKPIPTGTRCGVYERDDAVLLYYSTPNGSLTRRVFHLGAADVGTIRHILGVIAQESSLEVKITEWKPPLIRERPR